MGIAFEPGRESRWGLPAVLALAVVAGPRTAQAAEPAAPEASAAAPSPKSPFRPLHRLDSSHLIAARYNPLGLALLSRFSYQLRLYEASDALTRDNYVGIGVAPIFSPAVVRLGAFVEFQPLSALQLSATYEWIGYPGEFDTLQSFPGVTSEHSDDTLDELSALPDGDPAKNYSSTGTQLTLAGVLQGKLGPVAVRNRTRLAYVDMDLREGDRTYWDIGFDLLAPGNGWFLVNDLDVLWVTEIGFVAGARWTATHAFYEARHYAPDETVGENPNSPHHRFGPLLAYTFWDHGGRGAFDKPTVLLIVNWWLEHRYRTGVEQAQALPYVVLGFSFTGDLLTVGK